MDHYYIGLDVGGTKIAGGLVRNGQVSHAVTVPTEADRGAAAVLANIRKVIAVFDTPQVAAVGIGITGQVNTATGTLVQAHNLPKGLQHFPLAKRLSKAIGKPVSIENDARCFTLGEAMHGAGRRYDLVVGMTLGTGIGGGIVAAGHIVRGRNGTAGEVGHLTIVEHGAPCSCGQRGHLEAYASGPGLAHLYQELSGRKVDPREVDTRFARRETVAKKAYAMFAEALAVGLANIITVVNPDVIVVGGGLSRVRALWSPAIEQVKPLLLYDDLRATPIVPATLGASAPILGAALVAQRELNET